MNIVCIYVSLSWGVCSVTYVTEQLLSGSIFLHIFHSIIIKSSLQVNRSENHCMVFLDKFKVCCEKSTPLIQLMKFLSTCYLPNNKGLIFHSAWQIYITRLNHGYAVPEMASWWERSSCMRKMHFFNGWLTCSIGSKKPKSLKQIYVATVTLHWMWVTRMLEYDLKNLLAYLISYF